MMFEKEIRFIVDFNINKIKRLGAFFTINDLINSDIHPAIVQYISAELNYLLHLDRKKILKESVFDYSGKEISYHFEKIAEIIKVNKLLPFEDVKRLVEQAVIFNMNFVIRPRWTLKRFVYDTEDKRFFEDVKLFLKYCYFYPYYPNILIAYFDKKAAIEITASDFESSLYKIEAELIKSQQRTIIEETFKAISDFVNIGEGNKKLVAVGMVEMSLKEKGLKDYISKIRTLLSDDPKQKFEVDDFRTAIFSDIAVGLDNSFISAAPVQEQGTESIGAEPLPSIKKGLFSSFFNSNEPQTDKENNSPQSQENELEQLELLLNSKLNIFKEKYEEESEAHQDDQGRVGGGTLELFDEEVIKEMTVDKSTVPEKPSPKVPEPPQEPGIKSANSVVPESSGAINYESEGEPESKPESEAEEDPGILNLFSTRETMRIVSAIFNNDSIDFVNTMERINECADRNSALSLINAVFLSYKINAFSSSEASLLIQKIEKFFAMKG